MRAALALLAGCLMAFAAAAAELPKYHATEPNLTVLADTDLMSAIAPLLREYTRRTHTPITLLPLYAEGAEARILQGQESHVLISRDEALVDRLVNQGLTDVTHMRHYEPQAGAAAALVVLASESMGQARALVNFLYATAKP